MDNTSLEQAILRLAIDSDLLASVRESPATAGAQLGIDQDWADAILNADRDRLRSAGLNDGITILVSRWFKGDLGDSASTGRFVVDATVGTTDDSGVSSDPLARMTASLFGSQTR